MALYRNIAGIPDSRRVGLSLYDMPSLTLIDSGSTSPLVSALLDPVAAQQQRAAADAAYEQQMNANYDYLLSTPVSDLTAAGYYVSNYPDTSGNGSIFQWTDTAHTTSTAYLSLDWIQHIENARGTPGALLLHMQQPVLAKDTAGYAGGNSATDLISDGIDPTTYQVADPIPAVQTLPTTTDTTVTPPATTHTTAIQPTSTQTNLKTNFLPLALIAGLTVVAIAGEDLLHARRKLVFAGGVGALFYLMAKKS